MAHTRILRIDQVKNDLLYGPALSDFVETYRLADVLHQMNVERNRQSNGGACRCFLVHGKKRFFGFSDRDRGVHAEEDCFAKIREEGHVIGGSDFWLMYVDLEPCHSGRYRGHNCRAYFDNPVNLNTGLIQRFGLRLNNALYYPYYTNGLVIYAFDQTEMGEKSEAQFMHDNEGRATNMFLAMAGTNTAEYNRNVHGIEYFKLGRNQ